MPRRNPDPQATREALAAVTPWVDGNERVDGGTTPTTHASPTSPTTPSTGAGAAGGTAAPVLDRPPRPVLAEAVRTSLRLLEHLAPGHTVEVRVPPFGAVQCIDGPRHTRGTPPNIIETDPATWLALAIGRLGWDDAVAAARVSASGHRVGDIARWLPVAPSPRSGDMA